jgi:hypothetical protein
MHSTKHEIRRGCSQAAGKTTYEIIARDLKRRLQPRHFRGQAIVLLIPWFLLDKFIQLTLDIVPRARQAYKVHHISKIRAEL